MDKKQPTLIAFIIALGIIILYLIFYPFLLFCIGYFSGWIAKITFGAKLASALNIAFHTSWFTAEMLPMIGGALAWIGSFFKTNIPSKINEKTSKTYTNY